MTNLSNTVSSSLLRFLSNCVTFVNQLALKIHISADCITFILAQNIHNNKSPLVSVQSPNILLNITMYIQGSYNPATNLQTADTIRAFLRYSSSPYVIADSSKGVLGVNGISAMKFPNAISGTKHRNSIEI